jgi:hypothetical protein
VTEQSAASGRAVTFPDSPALMQRGHLLSAARRGDGAEVQRYLEGGVDVNCRDEVGALTLWDWMEVPLCVTE